MVYCIAQGTKKKKKNQNGERDAPELIFFIII